MKTREIKNKYGTVTIIDDIDEAKKVLAELKATAAIDAFVTKKAVARHRHEMAETTFVSEEKVPGKKANRTARRAERRARKKTAKRVANALKLYEEAVTEELQVHDVQVPSVYQKNVPAGLGICSDLQRQFCVQLYGNEKDALFIVPGTKIKYSYLGSYVEESEIPDDIIILPEIPNDRILEPEDFNKIIFESHSYDTRIWASEIRMSKLRDKPDFVLMDDGLHKWNDLSSYLRKELDMITEYNERDFFLDAVCFTTVDGSEIKVLFYSETLHAIAESQKYLPIQPYDYKPEPIFYGTTKLFFGQEFEFEFKTFSNLKGFLEELKVLSYFVYFKKDGSLMGYSVEVVTHPCSFEIATSLCRDITRTAIKHRATTAHCGHHVHVSRDAFSEKEVNLMVKTVHDLWEEVICFSERNADEVDVFCADSFIRDCGRYAAVNIMNAATVEIRIMKAKLNIDKAVDNLTFVRMLGDSVKKENTISLESWLRARRLSRKRKGFFSYPLV